MKSVLRFLVRPSNIQNAGVGCFACQEIQENVYVNSEDVKEGFRKLDESEIPDEYLKFCILLSSGKYLSPENFLKMGVFWYINHAKNPNVEFKDGRLIARRHIKADEELTLYYSDLLTHPKNKSWVTKDHI